jgi:hypothetical protein
MSHAWHLFQGVQGFRRPETRPQKTRAAKDNEPRLGRWAGLVASLGGELVEVLRYFLVHFSTFQVGPWLVGLSTSPPIDVL